MKQRDICQAYRMVSGMSDMGIDNSARSLAASDPVDWQTTCPCTPGTTLVDTGSCDMPM